jgi:hypothetical protein
VTLAALDIRVFAVEFECGPIMIELRDFPFIRFMALGAIGFSRYSKLIVMIVLVTLRTGCRQSRKTLYKSPGRIGLEMTGPAECLLMGTGKCKPCFGMIKGNLRPFVLIMTGSATRFRIEF